MSCGAARGPSWLYGVTAGRELRLRVGRVLLPLPPEGCDEIDTCIRELA